VTAAATAMMHGGDWTEVMLRLAVAAAAGTLIGLERAQHNRGIMGIRTLGLVALASCIAVLAIARSGLPGVDADAIGRIVQGVLSGVGFIGAGALLHGSSDQQVHGLATAASIWVSAVLGTAAALAVWPLIIGGLVIGLLILFVGAPVERMIRDHARKTESEQDRRDIQNHP
jgi:putative Mg2+ transporter-C (MgtC) family protein